MKTARTGTALEKPRYSVRVGPLIRAGFVFSSVLLCFPAGAAKSWFTSITANGQTTPISAFTKNGAPKIGQATEAYIDLVVSIYKKADDDLYPNGDDDGNTQGKAGSEEQDNHERIIQYMADAVFEATDGRHKLRNVRMFRRGERANDADIVWEVRGSVRATVNGVVGRGGHIYMYDTGVWFQKDGSERSSFNFLADEEGAGYTLAHEMGHYWYGIFDEYKNPDKKKDVPVEKSIMNAQWRAKGGNPEWLNFSIAAQRGNPRGNWINTKKTDQHRNYGESAWETLSRDPGSDPKPKDLNAAFVRPFYPIVAAAAPSETNTPTINLPSSQARDHLNIIWSSEGFVFQIVLDRSGSMSGEKLENAKTAATLLVDKAAIGQTQIGVVVFDSSPEVLTPITFIESPATKEAIKAQIAGIMSQGGTDIGSAAAEALAGLTALGTVGDAKVVFLLTDGVGGIDPDAVIRDYQAAQVPIFSFAFGDGADVGLMDLLATATGGALFISPTSLSAVASAFEQAFQRARGSQGVDSQSTQAAAAPSDFTFEVDSTMGQLDLSVVHSGPPDPNLVTLTSPEDEVFEPVSTTETPTETLLFYSVEAPAQGQWTITLVSAAPDPIDVDFFVSSLPDGTTYALAVSSVGGQQLVYPAPFLVVATLEREAPIGGAGVRAVVTNQTTDTQTVVTLADDGVAPDETADDGRYSGLVFYDEDGIYTVDVEADNADDEAFLSFDGTTAISPDDFVSATPPSEMLEGIDFQRKASLQVSVTGVLPDDHGNDPSMATVVMADNSDTPGRIETAGDVDYFEMNAPEGVFILSVRVSGFAGGMDPQLTVFNADGETVLAEGTLATHPSPEGYLLLDVLVTPQSTYFASVRDTSAAASGGSYQFSVGTEILTDISAFGEGSERLLAIGEHQPRGSEGEAGQENEGEGEAEGGGGTALSGCSSVPAVLTRGMGTPNVADFLLLIVVITSLFLWGSRTHEGRALNRIRR